MNTLKTILLATFLASTFAVQASEIKKEDKKVKQQVTTALSQTESETEGAVNAKFTVENDGTINIIAVEATKSTLKDKVTNKLKDVQIKGKTYDLNNIYNMNFIFKKEKK